MADPVKNTTTQNITSLTYKATGINNSERTISEAMSALYVGIWQWGTYDNTGDIQNAISNGDITPDTYIAWKGPERPIVDTAGNLIELYG